MQLLDLSPSEIDDVLAAQTVARIACQEEGRPYIVPVAYAYADGAVLVHSLEGAKVRIMRANPRVCVQVDAVSGMTDWRSVVGWGDFEELAGDEARAALRALVARLLPPGAAADDADPFCPPGLEDRVVLFRVKLAERSGRAARP
jgi:nitroimidazol reductase NimA-like FMN-containing flavoprotein (pyridoxamine 5'-phosphate oxidase superfamily)